MNLNNKYRGKKIIIMGLGNYENGSGISAALFFVSRGAKVLVTDLKLENELKNQIKRLKKYKNIKYVLGRHRRKDFKDADFIFQNPSVPRHSPYLDIARQRNIPIINDWSIFLARHSNFLIGVTGTRGKSTTTILSYQFIKVKNNSAVLAGNIGVSPLKFYGKLKEKNIVVAELSSWLLSGFEIARKSPNISIITNLLEDHLNKYKSTKEYYADKKNIFRFQNKNDYLILNRDDKKLKKMAEESKSQVFWFRKKPFKGNGIFIKGRKIIFKNNDREENICDIYGIKLIGEHNLENVLAAICAAKIYGVSNSAIKKVLNKFNGLPNRLELIKETGGIKYYNDTTATSPDGAIAALNSFKGYKEKIVLLAGGADKNLNYKKFCEKIRESVKALILFNGEATERISAGLEGARMPVIYVNNMKEAVENARKFAKKGDIVLLSPGAASFGIFINEFDRGEQFHKEVQP